MIREQVSPNVTVLRQEEGQSSANFQQEIRQVHTEARDEFHEILVGEHKAALEHLEAARQNLKNSEKVLRHFRLVSEDIWPHAQSLTPALKPVRSES